MIGASRLAVLGSVWHRNDIVRLSQSSPRLEFVAHACCLSRSFVDEYKPTLKELERILAEAGLDEAEMKMGAAAAGAGGGSGQSRNRR